MGMNKYVHIGPYLLIPKLQKSVTRTIRVDASGREVKGGHKFDPVTGEAYKQVSVTEDKINRPRSWGDDEHYEQFEAMGLEEDAFFQGEGCETNTHSIFLANEHVFTNDDEEPTSMLGLDIEDEMLKFMTTHKKYIDYYTEVYGPVIVDYGVVPYWS